MHLKGMVITRNWQGFTTNKASFLNKVMNCFKFQYGHWINAHALSRGSAEAAESVMSHATLLTLSHPRIHLKPQFCRGSLSWEPGLESSL